MVPWKVLATGETFLTFMVSTLFLAERLSSKNIFQSSYSVIMGPISACLTADYWVRALRYIIVLSLCIIQFVKRGAYDVKALYDPHGIYRYSNGLNWRALLTLVLTVTPNLVRLRVRIISAVSCCSQPGLINAVNPDIYIGNISWYYAPGFITGCKPVFFLFV